MIEMTTIGMGLMTTAVAVAVGGLALEAMRLMLRQAFRVHSLAASFEPVAIHLSWVESAVAGLNSVATASVNSGRSDKGNLY